MLWADNLLRERDETAANAMKRKPVRLPPTLPQRPSPRTRPNQTPVKYIRSCFNESIPEFLWLGGISSRNRKGIGTESKNSVTQPKTTWYLATNIFKILFTDNGISTERRTPRTSPGKIVLKGAHGRWEKW